MKVSDRVLQEIRRHAEEEFPRECCGMVVVRKGRQQYVRCRNIAESTEHFLMHEEDQAHAEDYGDPVLVVHSHPNVAPNPSQADLVGIESTGLPWLIVNWPTGQYTITAPSGYVAPLIGREFVHGILDCYSLIRDLYRLELGIALPDFDRRDNWWEKGEDLYRQNFFKAGFVQIRDDEIKPYDGLLMQVSAPVPNHGAVYLGDNRIIHHFMNRLSSREVYGGYWHKNTVMVVRHESFL